MLPIQVRLGMHNRSEDTVRFVSRNA